MAARPWRYRPPPWTGRVSPTSGRRGTTLPQLYNLDQAFEIGGSYVVRNAVDDRATIIDTGITVHEAIAAANELNREGISVRVIHAYSVPPLTKRLHQAMVDRSARCRRGPQLRRRTG